MFHPGLHGLQGKLAWREHFSAPGEKGIRLREQARKAFSRCYTLDHRVSKSDANSRGITDTGITCAQSLAMMEEREKNYDEAIRMVRTILGFDAQHPAAKQMLS